MSQGFNRRSKINTAKSGFAAEFGRAFVLDKHEAKP